MDVDIDSISLRVCGCGLMVTLNVKLSSSTLFHFFSSLYFGNGGKHLFCDEQNGILFCGYRL